MFYTTVRTLHIQHFAPLYVSASFRKLQLNFSQIHFFDVMYKASASVARISNFRY
jgi:hypothetical protein